MFPEDAPFIIGQRREKSPDLFAFVLRQAQPDLLAFWQF